MNTRFSKSLLAGLFAAVLGILPVSAGDGTDNEKAESLKRVTADVEYLASDELEGRGVETKGIHLAADYIVKEYKRLGLKPGMPGDSYEQHFDIQLSNAVNTDGSVLAVKAGETAVECKPGEHFQPLSRGGEGKASGEVVFVGYGIEADDLNFDEYDGVDVEGKIVFMIRREPQQDDPESGFDGKEVTRHSFIETKVTAAKNNNAAGIIMVNDPHTIAKSDGDSLLAPEEFGSRSAGIPFVQVTLDTANRILAASGVKTESGETLTTVEAIEAHINENLKPLSQTLEGVTADISNVFTTESIDAINLIGVLEGDGPLADETIVIGGHYDHLGLGAVGSRTPRRFGEIHNGADDNATGTAAVLEMARRICAGPTPKRRIVFICFSGEERGLLGSYHYVANPAIPLEKTIAMLNFDMIGNLRNDHIDVYGTETCAAFRGYAEKADEESELNIDIKPSSFAGSDHLPFLRKQVPVMFCFTGLTDTYHTPDDDFDTLNLDGTVRVIDFTESLFRQIDAAEDAPKFQSGNASGGRNARPRRLPVLGIKPSFSGNDDVEGVPVRAITEGSPAEEAGLQVGDVIVKIGDRDVKGYADVIRVLSNSKPEETIPVKVVRDGEEVETDVKLGKPE